MKDKESILITLPASLTAVLVDLKATQNSDFFIIGATARDILFEYHHKLPPQIATKDIDIAVVIKDWSTYETLKQTLIQSTHFSYSEELKHRLVHKSSIPVDIIPYGQIADENQEIMWPSTHKSSSQSIMSVKGYLETSKHLLNFKISEDCIIQVPTAYAQFLLKLLAWHDNPNRKHDAQDIDFILRNYLQADNIERLFEEHQDLITEQFDTTITGAQILGRDLSKTCSEKLRALMIEILNDAITTGSSHALAVSMIQTFDNLDQELESKISLLKAVLQGLR